MITVEHLTKRYGPAAGIEDVSFTCHPGTVTGFLGPNGAGKSTTLRVLAGLTRPQKGRATVLGQRYRNLEQPARRVGVLLDASAQHSGRAGRESLVIAADTIGVSRNRVDEVLHLVGLDGKAGRRRIGNYSLGMRQRLGLAHALLGDPEVLILDEPANGLDPAGIHWMRELLRGFAARGGTVLLSSHLLGEVQATADELVIIAGGQIVAQGTTDELLAGNGVRVRATDTAALADALRRAGLPHQAPDGDRFVVDASAEAVGRAALDGGVILLELADASSGGLEELFLNLTGTSDPGGATTDTAPATKEAA